MVPRPTPRPARPAPQPPSRPKPFHPQYPCFRVLESVVGVILFRTGDPPFDIEAPEPEFPLYIYALPSS